MARNTRTNFAESFRLVVTKTLAGEDYTEYVGPYQTIGAAKGQLTDQLKLHTYEQYSKKVGYIERSTGWEKVDV